MSKLESLWQRARSEMDSYGLQDWKLIYTGTKSRVLGSTTSALKTIELSAPHAYTNTEEQAWDTVLHEIAHALAGPDANHGPAWARVARKIGANPSRATDLSAEDKSDYKVVGECHKGHQYGRTNMPKRGTIWYCNTPSCVSLPRSEKLVTWRRNNVAEPREVTEAVRRHGKVKTVPLSRVGERVRVIAPTTRFDGLVGSIYSVGRTNYVVELPGELRKLRLPFSATEPATFEVGGWTVTSV